MMKLHTIIKLFLSAPLVAKINGDLVIGEGSCIPDEDDRCVNAGDDGGSAKIGDYSCIGGGAFQCYDVGLEGDGTIGNSSCNYGVDDQCGRLGSEDGLATIGNGSCNNGTKDQCADVGAGGGYGAIGDGSCTGGDDGLCCRLGFYGNGTIGNGSCNGGGREQCAFVGSDFTSASIGDMSCNSGPQDSTTSCHENLAIIGSSACNADDACNFNVGTISDGCCNYEGACNDNNGVINKDHNDCRWTSPNATAAPTTVPTAAETNAPKTNAPKTDAPKTEPPTTAPTATPTHMPTLMPTLKKVTSNFQVEVAGVECFTTDEAEEIKNTTAQKVQQGLPDANVQVNVISFTNCTTRRLEETTSAKDHSRRLGDTAAIELEVQTESPNATSCTSCELEGPGFTTLLANVSFLENATITVTKLTEAPSLQPSQNPSASMKPSTSPSASIQPSKNPTASMKPSASPSLSSVPSYSPSDGPSGILEHPFSIRMVKNISASFGGPDDESEISVAFQYNKGDLIHPVAKIWTAENCNDRQSTSEDPNDEIIPRFGTSVGDPVLTLPVNLEVNTANITNSAYWNYTDAPENTQVTIQFCLRIDLEVDIGGKNESVSFYETIVSVQLDMTLDVNEQVVSLEYNEPGQETSEASMSFDLQSWLCYNDADIWKQIVDPPKYSQNTKINFCIYPSSNDKDAILVDGIKELTLSQNDDAYAIVNNGFDVVSDALTQVDAVTGSDDMQGMKITTFLISRFFQDDTPDAITASGAARIAFKSSDRRLKEREHMSNNHAEEEAEGTFSFNFDVVAAADNAQTGKDTKASSFAMENSALMVGILVVVLVVGIVVLVRRKEKNMVNKLVK